ETASTSPPEDSATAGGGTVTRFRNARSGLCLAVGGDQDEITAGAPAVTSTCRDRPGQLWRFGSDGLLRNADRPDLCLDSAQPFGLELSSCGAATGDRAGDFRYELSPEGLLASREMPDLVVVPARRAVDAPIVLKALDGAEPGRGQLWTTETESEAQAGAGTVPAPSASKPLTAALTGR
ncbi:ricin-type beta-trefoil lectin domain protein, partial [Streptomyces sp. GC420]|uniref:ricin-type beta-trefoil lectin domain protein n=1 Tax=Streptomyces sp. GC420 TaxID=2697568 RepID=UPI001414D9BF